MSETSRYRPLRETFNFQRQCNQILEEGVSSGLDEPLGWMQPAVDLRETGEAFFLEMAIPGFDPEDIHLSITENQLSVCWEVPDEARSEESSTYHLRKRKQRSFIRTIQLPARIAIDRAEAIFQNGELRLRLPKIRAPAAHTIEIKAE